MNESKILSACCDADVYCICKEYVIRKVETVIPVNLSHGESFWPSSISEPIKTEDIDGESNEFQCSECKRSISFSDDIVFE